MKSDSIFSPRLLAVWIVGAMLVFAITLYFMGSEDQGTNTVGPSTFSRSAIGYAGIAEVLQQLDITVKKSRYDSLSKVTTGSVLVIAEPLPGANTEATIRTLLKADSILLVLPKWTGSPSAQKAAWLGEAALLPMAEVDWVLNLVAPQADALQVDQVAWTSNSLNIAPTLQAPIQLVHGDRLQPLIASKDGMLLGQLVSRNRKIWVLSDPDVISNHGFAEPGNAALAVAIINGLRSASGSVVFDETLHGFISEPASPILLLFRFPFVLVTLQALIAMALLLWATLRRFGAPQPAPPAVSAGRLGLPQNIAKLLEFSGHQEVMIRRYVLETVRDVARRLHAPRGLSTPALVAWLQRVGAARDIDVDCGEVIAQAEGLTDGRRRSPASLVRLARDIHRWRGEIVDGRARNPRDR
ncbi:MAG: DUF4350 domain-containing protein [Xanthobacteraceae bacterium]